MRTAILTLLLSGFIFAFNDWAWAHHAETEPSDGTVASFKAFSPPKILEDFTFTDTAGKAHSLKSFSGKIVLVNIWATWCPPCVAELPALDRLQARFKNKPFVILALSTDRKKPAYVERAFKDLGITNLGLYFDPWHASKKAFPLDVLPANFLIGPEGKAHAFLRSAVDWDSPAADTLIQYYLDEGHHP